MRKKVLLVSPVHRNGGITSWTRKFIQHFPQTEYELILIASDPKRAAGDPSILQRITSGLAAMFRVMKGVHHILRKGQVNILHKTTSGSLGSLTDWALGRYCRKKEIRNVLHCHYGCIPEILCGKSLLGWLTLKSMQQFDQIWVLDKRTYQYLRQRDDIRAEVILIPNCISVEKDIEISPKNYTNVAFVGNLYETKGILELIEAMKQVPDEVNLHIVGDGEEIVKQHIHERAGELLGNRIKMYGRLPNDEAVAFMKRMDILALPTYYPYEAFPISILEAMSLGKLVISTRRAAIGDMLTIKDGRNCGILVGERNVNDIAEAICWAFSNKKDADILCKLAYNKVYNYYREEVIYKLYSDSYSKFHMTTKD